MISENLINYQLLGHNSNFENDNRSQNNSIIPHSTAGNRRLNPKDFAEARKRAKQGRKGKAADLDKLPLTELSDERLGLLHRLVGEGQTRRLLRDVARRREKFLDSDPEIRAAARLEKGCLIFETAGLSEAQRSRVLAFVQGAA